MRYFITGGCKNGKSLFAQHLAYRLAGGIAPLYYIATMQPADKEDVERVQRHIAEREGYGFVTLECPRMLEQCTQQIAQNAVVLLDSTTALLSNEMFDHTGNIDMQAVERIIPAVLGLAGKVAELVVVSDWIYGDAEQYDYYTETYRRGLARIDRALAAECEVVCEIVFGVPVLHKGRIV